VKSFTTGDAAFGVIQLELDRTLDAVLAGDAGGAEKHASIPYLL
jgi:hypothetical protein